ncbi:MAG: glycosyltransferase family 4 protein [Terriglobales bacterium]
MNRVRVLFLPAIDAENTNAQSLNVRELALRLDPERIQSTLWYQHQPDERLRNHPAIRLLQLPSRAKTIRIVNEMVAGYDIIAYIDYSPASYLFLHLPRKFRCGAKAVLHAEAPAAQIGNPSSTLRFLYRGIVPRCDVYTGITEFVARDLEGSLNDNGANSRVSYILPVGVDTSRFTPPLRRTNSTPVVLFAGTMVERKGPQHVIDAATQLPGANFRLVGAGRDGFEEVLRERITRLGLKNVSLEGPKTQAQMADIMRNSDVFVLPSRLEGIPKVTLEAGASGLPCVVFRDYATPSVVDGVTGFQVGTAAEMTGALGKLISDPALRQRMGAAARQHMQNFEWGQVSRLWERAYLETAMRKS